MMFANSKGQLLEEHLFAVGYIAKEISKTIKVKSFEISNDSFYSGIFHDIGKVDPYFQNYIKSKINTKIDDSDGVHASLKEKIDEDHPLHHEISWMIYQLSKQSQLVKSSNIAYGIYWHHSKLKRDNKNLDSLKGLCNYFNHSDNLDKIKNDAKIVFEKLKKICKSHNFEINDLNYDKIEDDTWEISTPKFKKHQFYYEFRENLKNNLIRYITIAADRIVSSISSEELSERIKSKTLDQLIQQPINFIPLKQILEKIDDEKIFKNNDRTKCQNDASEEIARKREIFIVAAPAGVGKTRIALRAVALTGDQKQIIWICPRTSVCESVFAELQNNKYLPNNISLEIYTGSQKKIFLNNEIKDVDNPFSSNIVITTIDQVLSIMTSHQKAHEISKLLNSHIIFDEFHELRKIPSMFFLYGEFLQLRNQIEGGKTILLSATPNIKFIDFYNKKSNTIAYSVIDLNSFNEKPINLKLNFYKNGKNPMNEILGGSFPTICIYNTASAAQRAYLNNLNDETALIAHGSYSNKDKIEMLEKIYEHFGEKASNFKTGAFSLIRSGPILKASHNISCKIMHIEATDPDDMLQGAGRKNRFQEWDESDLFINVPVLQNDKIDGRTATMFALDSLGFCKNTAKDWILFLKNKIGENTYRTNLNELYQWYNEFYKDPKFQIGIEKDLEKLINEAEAPFKKDQDYYSPIKIISKDKKTVNLSSGFRGGNSVYVNACIADNNLVSNNSYLYDINNIFPNMLITVDRDIVKGSISFIKSDKKYIAKNIYKLNKYQYETDGWLDWRIKRPESPLFVSFINSDKINCKLNKNSDFFYYVPFNNGLGGNFGVGLIKLNNQKDEGEDYE